MTAIVKILVTVTGLVAVGASLRDDTSYGLVAVGASLRDDTSYGDAVTFYTSGTSDNDVGKFYLTGLESMELKSVVVYIRACSDASIVLAASRNDFTTNATEVRLGSNLNSQSFIRDWNNKDDIHATHSEPNILSCSDYLSFWLSWDETSITVGKDNIPGASTIMTANRQGAAVHDVAILVFNSFTPNGKSASWQLREGQGLQLSFMTLGDSQYQHAWQTVEHRREKFMTFSAVGQDLYVALGARMGQVQYHIRFGTNKGSKLELYQYGGTEAKLLTEVDLPFNVSVSMFTAFWISWDDGRISVGSGFSKSQKELLQWNITETEVPIGAVGYTSANDNDATFLLKENPDEMFTIFTNQQTVDGVYEAWAEAPRQQYMSFFVEACSDVHIVLSKQRGIADEKSINISIYREDSNVISISGLGAHTEQNVGPYFLQCGLPKAFWISWKGNTITVGTGIYVGFNTILGLSALPDLAKMQVVGFGTAHAKGALFTLPKYFAAKLVFQTKDNYVDQNTWIATQRTHMLEFELRACANAHMVMSEAQGLRTPNEYHVEFGYNGNTHRVAIWQRDGVSDKERLVANNTAIWGLLECNKFLQVRLSWTRDTLHLDLYTVSFPAKELLRVARAGLYPINTISLSSEGSTTKADWKFMMPGVNQISTVIPREVNTWHNRWVALDNDIGWTYFRINWIDVRFMLTRQYYQTAGTIYYIEIDVQDFVSLYKNEERLAIARILDTTPIRYMDVWVSWQEGILAFGLGITPNVSTLVSAPLEDNYKIGAIGINNTEFGFEWIFPSENAKEISFETSKKTENNQQWRQVHGSSSLIFAVKASAQAELLFATGMPRSTNVSITLALAIGANGNTLTQVKNSDKVLQEWKTPNILSDTEFRTFWVTWKDGELAAGTGNVLGLNVFAAYYSLGRLPIGAVGFTTGNEYAGQWKLRLKPGDFEPPYSPKSEGGGLSVGAIIGIAVGGSLIMVLIAVALGYVLCSKTLRRSGNLE